MSVRARGIRSRQTRSEVLRELNRSVSRSPEIAPESQVDKIKRKNDDSIALRRKKSRTQENMNSDLDSARRSFANTINSCFTCFSEFNHNPTSIINSVFMFMYFIRFNLFNNNKFNIFSKQSVYIKRYINAM